jgi:hypothetical protein
MAGTTDFHIRCEILADVWIEYREDEGFKELIEFADLGFPLAYLIDNGIVESNYLVEGYVDETFQLLLKTLKLEDTGFDNITDLFETATKNNTQE